MIMTNKIVAVALVTALIGASLGAIVMHSRDTTKVADNGATVASSNTALNDSDRNAQYRTVSDQQVPAEFTSAESQTAYKVGFSDGFQAATENRGVNTVRQTSLTRRAPVYRSSANSRRVYYDYNQNHGRSFWSKHRDKLTMAMGTGGGALIGALVGGKKGAAIGSLAGLGGSALYTYKLRKRNR